MNVIQAKYFYAPKTHEINWEKAEPWRTFFKKNNTLLRYVVQSRTHFDSLRPHGLQHARLPCPSLSPQVCSNSCPLSQWFYLTISCSTASSHIIYPFKIYNLIFFCFLSVFTGLGNQYHNLIWTFLSLLKEILYPVAANSHSPGSLLQYP